MNTNKYLIEKEIIEEHKEEEFKKRLVIGLTFSKIKNNRKIQMRYESKIRNYMRFLYISFMKILC